MFISITARSESFHVYLITIKCIVSQVFTLRGLDLADSPASNMDTGLSFSNAGLAKADQSKVHASRARAGRKEREQQIAAATAAIMGPVLPPEILNERQGKGTLSLWDSVIAENASSAGDATQKSAEDSSAKYDMAVVEQLRLPVSHEALMTKHGKVVSTIDVDKAGARMVSGSFDYLGRVYDFHGMKERMACMRQIEPFEGHPVLEMRYSPTGAKFVVATGNATAKVFDRDAVEVLQCRKGDPYIHDQAKTVGHVSSLTGCDWHPVHKEVILTSSTDGTMRTWHLQGKQHFDQLMSWQVIKARNKRGLRTGTTRCRFNASGRMMMCGCQDGSLQIFREKPRYHRADMRVEAHPGHEVVGIAFEPDEGFSVASRGMDDCLRLWDIRRFTEPVKVFENLECIHSTTDVEFSPDGSLVLTGTSVHHIGKKRGQLFFFDVQSAKSEPIYSYDVGFGESVVACKWDANLNQIFCGTSAGNIRTLYHPKYSRKGVMLSAGKRQKPRSDYYTNASRESLVRNPHALKMYADRPNAKKARLAARKDPALSKKPFKPRSGPRAPDYVPKAYNRTAAIIAERKNRKYLDLDPREALLAYHDQEQNAPKWVKTAYKETQPDDPTQRGKGMNHYSEKSVEQEALDKNKVLQGKNVSFL